VPLAAIRSAWSSLPWFRLPGLEQVLRRWRHRYPFFKRIRKELGNDTAVQRKTFEISLSVLRGRDYLLYLPSTILVTSLHYRSNEFCDRFMLLHQAMVEEAPRTLRVACPTVDTEVSRALRLAVLHCNRTDWTGRRTAPASHAEALVDNSCISVLYEALEANELFARVHQTGSGTLLASCFCSSVPFSNRYAITQTF